MQEKFNILDILKKTKKGIEKKDILLLKKLSNRTIHSASLYRDPDSVLIAVIVYSLSKIVEREKYSGYKDWPIFLESSIKNLEKSIEYLKKNNIMGFRNSLISIRKTINKLSGNLKIYIKDVFRKAMVNKASRIYEHGLSLENTAKLLGITEWELAEYAGKTGISDVDLNITMPMRKRIEIAKKFFEL